MKGINIAEAIAITSVMIIKKATIAKTRARNALADMHTRAFHETEF